MNAVILYLIQPMRIMVNNYKSRIVNGHRIRYFSYASVNTPDDHHDSVTSQDVDVHLLEHFNTASSEEIARFNSVSLQRAADIVAYREQNGKFQSMIDITSVTNIGSRTVARIIEEYKSNGYHLPKTEVEPETSRYKLARKVLYPTFAALELPESAVAFCVQSDAVYWAKMTRNLCVTDWSYITLGKYMHRKYDHVFHLYNLWKTLQAVPHGSLYLVEEAMFLPPARSLTSAALNLARLDSMLMLALNLRHDEKSIVTNQPPEQRVHRIKTNELARHFDLLVGKEKVSSQGVVMDIIKGQRTNCEVFVPHQQRSEFTESRRNIKEQLSNCLLQVTMFYELLLEQNSGTNEQGDFSDDSVSSLYSQK